MKISINRHIAIVFIFFIPISICIIGMVFQLDSIPQNTENRKLAELPSINVDVNTLRFYPKNFTKYYNDHFGFRNRLIVMNFLIWHNILRESPSTQVLPGKNGWLFYTNDDAVNDYRGVTHYDNNTLQLQAISYQQKRKYLLKHGIKYILVLAPNKGTIYGEWMPDRMYKIRKKSGMDEYIEYLANNTDVDIIDLRKTLLDNKIKEQLYLKTSSHWNDYAGFLAYREIMKLVSQWFPKVEVDSLDEYNITREEVHGDDLAEIMGGRDFFKEQKINLVPIKPRKSKMVDIISSGTFKNIFSMKQDDNLLPRVVVFRDCYFDQIIPFLSEKFSYTRYYWQSWNPDTPIAEIITEVKPDIVIEEKVERFMKLPKSP